MRKNLKEARQKAGMTQQEVADYLRTDVRYVIKNYYNNMLIICENGLIYKKYRDGLYRLIPTHYVMGKYLRISLTANGASKTFFVHRLVAKEFVPNPVPNEFLEVNHINGVPDDNRACNLEWCNRQQNVNHQKRMHAERYRTNLKSLRIKSGITTNKASRKIGIMIGRYRDIENAVKQPTKEEAVKLEKYFGESIENLMMEET